MNRHNIVAVYENTSFNIDQKHLTLFGVPRFNRCRVRSKLFISRALFSYFRQKKLYLFSKIYESEGKIPYGIQKMNISITNLCNRRCEYCFQRGWYLSNKAYHDHSVNEMNIEMFKDIIRWVGNQSNISIMGGEPLMHSQIYDIMEYCTTLPNNILWISNISIPHELFSTLPWNNKFGVMANMDWHNSQKSDFLKNLEWLKFQSIDCCLSTTVLPNFDIHYFEDRINACLKANSNVLSLRISTACPSSHQKFVQFKYDDLIGQIVNCASKYNIKIKFDCPIPTWEITLETKRLLRMMGVEFNSLSSCYSNPPFDVLWNGDIVWCSSCKDIRTNYQEHVDMTNARMCLKDQMKAKHGIKIYDISCFAKQEKIENDKFSG